MPDFRKATDELLLVYEQKVFQEIKLEKTTSESSLKSSEHLVTPNLLKKYQGFCPGAMPLTSKCLDSVQEFNELHISVIPCEMR